MLAISGLGESANEALATWSTTGTYIYGAPDYFAVGQSVRPYRFDESRVYNGVVGGNGRYWMYDQNLKFDDPGSAASQSMFDGVFGDGDLSPTLAIAAAIGFAAALGGVAFAAVHYSRRRR